MLNSIAAYSIIINLPLCIAVLLCVLVSEVSGRQHLRSVRRRQLSVPRVPRSTYGSRGFSDAGQAIWNSVPDDL